MSYSASVDLRQRERQELVGVGQARVIWTLTDPRKVRVATSKDERGLAHGVLPQVGNQLRVKNLVGQLVRDVDQTRLGSAVGVREPMHLLRVDDVVEQLGLLSRGGTVVREVDHLHTSTTSSIEAGSLVLWVISRS